MNDQNHVEQILKSFGEAQAILAPILANVKFFGLLRGALNWGLLEMTLAPSTPSQIAETLNLPEDHVVDLCYALDAHGVFVSQNGTYRLQDQWATLADPDSHRENDSTR